MKIFNQLQFIFVEYLYNPRHEPIDMHTLYSDFQILSDLLHIKLTGRRETDRKETSAKGLHKKTRKNNLANNKKSRVSFRRGPQKRRFKNPYFLSIK